MLPQRIILLKLAIIILASTYLCGCTGIGKEKIKLDHKYRIGLATTSDAQSGDALNGAEKFMSQFEDKSFIKQIVYPNNFIAEQETVITELVGLADDELVKAIVVLGIPGTVAAFKKIKEIRPDILLFVANPQEDPELINSVADMAISIDVDHRGYLVPLAAKKLGAKNFMFLSFPRHMSAEFMSRTKKIMQAACNYIGLNFIFESVPDPLSDIGIAGAQEYISQETYEWIKKYGTDTAFFCTVNSEIDPILLNITKHGGIFIEQYYPSTTSCYPTALNIKFDQNDNTWDAVLQKVEREVIKRGAANKMGAYKYPFNFITVAALSEYAHKILDKQASIDSLDDLIKCHEIYGLTADKLRVSYYHDGKKEHKNHVMMYQDTYIFGKGYLNLVDEVIPEEFLASCS